MVDAAGYGIKFREADRERHVDSEWNDVVLELDGIAGADPAQQLLLAKLLGVEIGGDRAMAARSARRPWRSGEPPAIVVHHLADNRFTARLLKRRDFLARS